MATSIVRLPEQAPGVQDGVKAHCRRVAAWCEEIAAKLKLPADESLALQRAALLHHEPKAFADNALRRLLADLGLPTDGLSTAQTRSSSALAEQILRAVRTGTGARPTSRAAELARILEAANLFDEQLEYAPFEEDQIDHVLSRAAQNQGMIDAAVGFVLNHLRRVSRDDLQAVLPKLPVYPTIAMRMFKALASSDVNLGLLEAIAKSDQVIAGKLVKAANSAYYSPWKQIRTVAQAISYVGIEDARRILLASGVQPLFSSPRLRHLWKHAIEAAQVTERIAIITGCVDPGEAFLAGLLHDSGKLAISLLPGEVNEAMERLIKKGCQPTTAELVLCGFDHADAGADVLRYWRLPEDFIEAVRVHHQPERTESPLASVLYLTEYWTDSEEDLPSHTRFEYSLHALGLSREVLQSARLHLPGPLNHI
jgi:HD-like signal output (HDOD) protein